MDLIECPVCHKKVKPSHKTAVYCSNKCALHARHARAAARTCPVCGGPVSGAMNKTYCSTECSREARKVRQATVKKEAYPKFPRFGFWGI